MLRTFLLSWRPGLPWLAGDPEEQQDPPDHEAAVQPAAPEVSAEQGNS